METKGNNLFESVREYEENNRKQGRRVAFALGTLAAIGITGALGVGFMLGGSSGGAGPQEDVAVLVSPTAASPAAGQQAAEQAAQSEGHALSSNAPPQGTTGGNSGNGGTGGEAPVIPTATPAPVEPTDTPEPTDAPAETPTGTPTVTPTATPEPGCVFCIDPEIINSFDFWPPEFVSGYLANCVGTTKVSVQLDEEATIWVEYTYYGPDTTAAQEGTSADFYLPNLWPVHFPDNVVVHAEDSWGNHATFDPPVVLCY